MNKEICVLGRRDITEAMRVASGLTILGHRVKLIFCSIVPGNETTKEQVELLELAEIEPLSAVEGNDMEVLSPDAISHLIQASDGILSM